MLIKEFYMIIEVLNERRLVRSRNSMFLGVFSGLGRTLGVDPLILRLLWLFSVLLFGSGILIYFFLAVLMPLEHEIAEFEKPKALGVCSKIGEQYGLEVSMVRMLFVAGFFFSLGFVSIVYLGLWFFLPEGRNTVYYRN
jgi:phage shock protein C